jgi:glycosyltransferase involved in cell wall biosynthesis
VRIAQVAPPFETVPPARYGGTERVVATLTEELVRRGHEVTLFGGIRTFMTSDLSGRSLWASC